VLYCAFFIVLPVQFRAFFVDKYLFYHTSTGAYGAIQSILNDAIIIFGILLLVYLSLVLKRHAIIKYLFRLFAFLIVCVYVADIFIVYNFSTHLIVADVIKYGAYAGKYIYQIYGIWILMLISLTVLAISLIIFDLDKVVIHHKRRHLAFWSIMLILFIAYCFRDNSRYVHSWIYKNVIDYNLSIRSQSANYSKAFMSNTPIPDEGVICFSSKPQKKNIIILMVESLSSYHSHFFSGIEDWTPHLDIIAEQNVSFTNFYANGYNTEDGYIAVLTGLLPISAPSYWSNDGRVFFEGFMDISASLPNIAKSHGYRTAFLTAGELIGFGDGQWAESIGFDYIEGSNHPYYAGWKKFHFQSIPDEALLNRVLTIALDRKNRPFLLFVSTLSSHHPFMNPENNRRSEQEVIRYVDKQIGRFYNELKQSDFFSSGMLIITADHHAMVPLKEAEIKKFGAIRAPARIPLIISYGDKHKQVENRAFQQTDIYNSLKNYLNDEKCVSRWLGDLITHPTVPPVFIGHKRGEERSLISIFHGSDDILVKLNGDNTTVLSPSVIGSNIANEVLNKINHERIARQKN
ncbi:MAG: LTA synthase family protein, partial [Desulfobacterales bacterium]